MRILWNTIFLYISLFFSFILNFIQIKILTNFVAQELLGKFFIIYAFSQMCSNIILLGIPFVIIRYLPKFDAEKEKNKITNLINVLTLCYFLLGAVIYIFLFLFGYRIGIFIYKDEIVAKYLASGFLVFFIINYFSIIFTTFNGLRKMHYSAGLNLLYLFLLTYILFIFREKLSLHTILRIYLFSVIPAIVLGKFLFYKKVGFNKFIDIKLFREIIGYWRYASLIGILSPFFYYIDKLLLGYFLPMSAVAIFTIVDKIKHWLGRILDVPMESIAPEVSYFWSKNRKEVLSKDLNLIIKLLFLLTIILSIPILVGGKEIILIISNYEYLAGFSPLILLIFSMLISSLYIPITTTMRAIGKISLYLLSDIIWLFSYIFFIILFIKNFGIVGVGLAHLFSSVLSLIFNFIYVSKKYTQLKLEGEFFIKLGVFSIILGIFTYFIFNSILLEPFSKVIILFLFILLCYLLFIFKSSIFSQEDKNYFITIFRKKLPFSNII